MKLTLHNRTTASLLECRIIDPKPKTKCSAKSATYRRPFVETNQTARISLQILAMSKSNPEDKQQDQCALTNRRARPHLPLNYPPSRPPEPQPVNPSNAPASASAAPVKGVLELVTRDRKRKKEVWIPIGARIVSYNMMFSSSSPRPRKMKEVTAND